MKGGGSLKREKEREEESRQLFENNKSYIFKFAQVICLVRFFGYRVLIFCTIDVCIHTFLF